MYDDGSLVLTVLPMSMCNPKHFYLCQSYWCKHVGSAVGCLGLNELHQWRTSYLMACLSMLLYINSGVRRSSCLHYLCCSHCSDIFPLSQRFLKIITKSFACYSVSPDYICMWWLYLTLSSYMFYCYIAGAQDVWVWTEDKKYKSWLIGWKEKPFFPHACPILHEKNFSCSCQLFGLEFIIFPSSSLHQCSWVLFPPPSLILLFRTFLLVWECWETLK